MSEAYLRLPAPAKLNLMLRIVGRREDGYHLLQTVFQFIDLCDWIGFTLRDDGLIRLENPLPGVPAESDLTVRAAKLVRSCVGKNDLGVTISVEKILPMGGGLGGGSSDAASTLLGLNRLWNLGLTIDQLAELGLILGADVPVFVRGYAAWAEGVGESLTPMPDLSEPWYVVVVPDCHVNTGSVFNSKELTRDNPPIKMTDFVAGSHENHCWSVVSKLYPEVVSAFNAVSKYGLARLTGTGACIFAEFESQEHAEEVREILAKEWKAFAVKGVNSSPVHKVLGLV